MLLAYIDESYTNQEYWFGAVLIPGDADANLQRAILEIPPRYVHHGVDPSAEVHGYPLWNGMECWSGLEPRLREDVMRRALREIPRAGGAVAFVGLDRTAASQFETLNVARSATIDLLLDCLEDYCAERAERCLLLFDEETSTSDELFDRVHMHHREILLTGDDPMIIERPVSVPSHDTPGVQIADVAVYLHARASRGAESDARAQVVRDRLARIVAPTICCHIPPKMRQRPPERTAFA